MTDQVAINVPMVCARNTCVSCNSQFVLILCMEPDEVDSLETNWMMVDLMHSKSPGYCAFCGNRIVRKPAEKGKGSGREQ